MTVINIVYLYTMIPFYLILKCYRKILLSFKKRIQTIGRIESERYIGCWIIDLKFPESLGKEVYIRAGRQDESYLFLVCVAVITSLLNRSAGT